MCKEFQDKYPKFSFPEFMDEYDVIIPKIQRDYAQGRDDSQGKKALERFSKYLVDALYKDQEESLDFVYGTVEGSGKKIKPLDGQQRLTTLLLLACLLGEHTKQDKEGKDRNWSFSYESRSMTQAFIDSILDKNNLKKAIKDTNDNNLSATIKTSEWFLSIWEEDYSVHGMLNMLDSLWNAIKKAEVEYNDKKPNLNRIRFFVKSISGSDKSFDQIYLKMNARGRALSDWDNLKACIDGHLDDLQKLQVGCQKSNDTDNDLKQIWQNNINLNWPEKIWKTKHSIEYVDKTMETIVSLALRAAFVDNVSLPEILWKDDFISIDDLVQQNSINQGHFDDYLGMDWSDENNKDKFIKNFFDYCNDFFSILTENSLKKEWMTAPWGVFFQLPDISSTQIYKYVILHYCFIQCEKKQYSDNVQKLLHRVIWNIVENTSIGLSDFRNAFLMFSRFLEPANAKDIILYLASIDSSQLEFNKIQIQEECRKAQLISGINGEEWNELIVKIEKHPLLRGNIRVFMADRPEISVFRHRVEVFEKLFSIEIINDASYCDEQIAKYCRSMLYRGNGEDHFDCGQPRGDRWQFPVNKNAFENMLEYHLKTDKCDDLFQKAFCYLLDNDEESPIDEQSVAKRFIDKDGHFRWQYYFIKYPDVFIYPNASIANRNGYYDWNFNLEMPRWLMTSNNLKAYHCNPFLLAISSQQDSNSVWCCTSGGDGKLCINSSNIIVDILDNELGFCVSGAKQASFDDQMFVCRNSDQKYEFILKPGNDLVLAGQKLVEELRKQI